MKQISEKCFSDKNLKQFIQAQGCKGLCSFTSSVNIKVIDLKELYDFFESVFDAFIEDSNGRRLINILQDDWGLFLNLSIGSKILKQLITDLNIKKFLNKNYIYKPSILEAVNYWDELKKTLKYKTRYITDLEKLEELGWDSYFQKSFQVSNNQVFYRARIHLEDNQDPYLAKEMSCPHKSKTRDGRANPLGIPYLYLTNDIETTLYEIRATYLDQISIGSFKKKDSIQGVKIIDFTIKESLFDYEQDGVDEIIKSHLLKSKISKDLSKPIRRYDSIIEYIPTQFICEYIKVITGADGIQFNSSLFPSGKNIVIFDQNKMTCFEVVKKVISKNTLECN